MKRNIFYTAALLAMIFCTSCIQDIYIPISTTLPEGVYIQESDTSISGEYEKIVDGENTNRNIVSEKRFCILTVEPNKKINYTEKLVQYYDFEVADGKRIFTSISSPRENVVYSSNGIYALYRGNKMIFELEDESRDPLQNGRGWEYSIQDRRLKIKKILNMQLDGGFSYTFEKQNEN